MNTWQRRALGVIVLVGLLFGLFVWAGTTSPNPAANRYPGTTALLEDYDAYVGERVQVGGTVMRTDPVVIAISNGVASRELTVRNAGQSVEVGDQLVVFGTVRAGNTVVVAESRAREPWEAQYMYAVSFLGGLWVLGRLVNGWTINTNRWTVEPRDTKRWSWRGTKDA
ncbi:MAG: hypothetical protein ABEI98_11470 [Halorhabdus sp.]